MSNPASSIETFLQRWSRRKRASARDDAHIAEKPPDDGGAAAPHSQPPTLNPQSLPPVEAIGAATDVRPFLDTGVPADLTRAALRRAWATDPAIRDFIGVADNQWDFTKTDGVPGFGPLKLTPDMERLVGELFGDFATIRPTQAEPATQLQTKADQTPLATQIRAADPSR
jgi:Protein of unknown function (DUF3306)